MSARFLIIALMLVIGIVIGVFAMDSKVPPERNAGNIASVQSVAALPEIPIGENATAVVAKNNVTRLKAGLFRWRALHNRIH